MSDTYANLTQEQKDAIFENISDGIIAVDSDGLIICINSACSEMFGGLDAKTAAGSPFRDVFLTNKKNLAFNRLFNDAIGKNKIPEKTDVRYRPGGKKKDRGAVKHLNIDVHPFPAKEESEIAPAKAKNVKNSFPGMIVIIEDITDRFTLKQQQHDCAYIFAGLIICISLFLMAWSFLNFTLHIYLKPSTYALIIECITFALFLEIVFMTSLSMRDIGLLPKLGRLKRDIFETAVTAAVSCLLLLLSKLVLNLAGVQIKPYFIGGSLHGALVYALTALVQEFLARGVIQTSVKRLMRVKYQKAFGIILTSLLFSLMHIPFGTYFMLGSLVLSLVLGYVYERQENIWGCVFLHWCCGYLAMCLYF